MKAAICREFGKPLSIEEISLQPVGINDVRVKLAACAICHSDITYADGNWGGDLPAVYGHEAAGIVVEAGAGVRNVKPGDHAVVTLVRSCGECGCCARGLRGVCESSFDLDANSPIKDSAGEALIHGLRTGGFAEEVIVDASQLVAIDKDVPLESAALLACGVITGLGAVTHAANVEAGTSVVIIGTGGVGLNSVQGAKLSGASPIIAVDLAADKLEAAMQFGATDAINSRTDDLTEEVMRLTAGRGADYVFVTVGAKPAFEQSFELIAKGGAVVLVGMPGNGVLVDLDVLEVANKAKRVIGSKMGNCNIHTEIPNLVRLYKQGRLKLDELISGRYRLDEINEAIASVKRGEALRNVIVFD